MIRLKSLAAFLSVILCPMLFLSCDSPNESDDNPSTLAENQLRVTIGDKTPLARLTGGIAPDSSVTDMMGSVYMGPPTDPKSLVIVSFAIPGVPRVRSYPLSNQLGQDTAASYILLEDVDYYATSGSLTVTHVTDSSMRGTFSFQAKEENGDQTISGKNGEFYFRYTY